MDERSDIELMEAVRDGDDGAFSVLVERHWNTLLVFFHRLTWDRDAAEDWAQEVFCRIYEARREYRPSAQFTTYLFRVARNYWIDCYRKKGRRPKEQSLESPGRSEGDRRGGGMRDRLAGDLPSPSDSLKRIEVLAQVRAALDELPPEQRIIFQLSEDQGMKYKEIAEALDIPLGTVKSRMFAAMNRLREILKARIEEP
ncbi:MAG: sigma-70 family RNA polymerase sigma factor [Planctomycetes bacterium]|nr:sigma-70 family RNA polymerase sigma factor [Planctomycetota bacterium]